VEGLFSNGHSGGMIQRVLAPNPGPMTLTGTNTYLLADQDAVAVIDPGPDDLPEHLDAILDAAAPLGRITMVLVTHRHGDHLPLAFPLCTRTGARLLGHSLLPGVQRPIADQEACFGRLVALETPGHTVDSLCFFDPESGDLFTGDLVAGSGTVIVDDTPGALAAYVGSLERLLALRPRRIHPGHGPLVDDAQAKLREYIDHRRQREQQVLVAVGSSGSATVEQLVAVIYTDVPSNLVPMAARNVRACLDKLLAEDRVVFSADRSAWQLTTR
jgi:glyoxylase-like metal-dependent hydrolase (beta-lactamase superfamily II)